VSSVKEGNSDKILGLSAEIAALFLEFIFHAKDKIHVGTLSFKKSRFNFNLKYLVTKIFMFPYAVPLRTSGYHVASMCMHKRRIY